MMTGPTTDGRTEDDDDETDDGRRTNRGLPRTGGRTEEEEEEEEEDDIRTNRGRCFLSVDLIYMLSMTIYILLKM